jgi:hypothetical protein
LKAPASTRNTDQLRERVTPSVSRRAAATGRDRSRSGAATRWGRYPVETLTPRRAEGRS